MNRSDRPAAGGGRAVLRAAMMLALSCACAAPIAAMDQLPGVSRAPVVKPRTPGTAAYPMRRGKVVAPTPSTPRTLKMPERGAVPATKTAPVKKSLPAIKSRAPVVPRAINPAPP